MSKRKHLLVESDRHAKRWTMKVTGWDKEALELLQTSIKAIALTRRLAIVNGSDPFGDHGRADAVEAPSSEGGHGELMVAEVAQ